MVMAINQPQPISEDDYLAFERDAEGKHEYADGTIIAMAGASFAHNLIVGNLITALNSRLRARGCFVLSSDLRVKIDSLRTYRYPDVTVLCEEPHFTEAQPQTLTNPAVVIEVLSTSTALIDRNAKLREYRQLPSLKAYWLVSQKNSRIETYTRQADDTWLYADAEGLDVMIALPFFEQSLALKDVYLQVDFMQSEGDA
jgi:Uma2 family endonuclease